MAQFQTNPWNLSQLLQMLDSGKIVLPEFQRSFVWRPADIDLLLSSLVQDFPAGSLLFLRADPQTPLAWRLVEGVPQAATQSPDYLVLDGQQRLSSLSFALNGRGDHLFFMDLNLLESGDIENGVLPMRRSEAERKKLLERERQWELHLYPAFCAMGVGADKYWFEDYVEFHAGPGGNREALRRRARELEETYVNPLKHYRFPVVELPADTSLEAVCEIFENLNKTGMRLTVFDLLTARFWPQGVNLRAMLERTRDDYPLLGRDEFDVDPTLLLQAVSLIRSGLCKRGDLLQLTPENFEADWEQVAGAASDALHVLKSECGILDRQWLPYAALFPSLFAISVRIRSLSGPQLALAWEKVKRWFWCSCFGQRYEGPANTLNATDYRQVNTWLENDTRIPEAVDSFALEGINLRRIERQRNAVYRAAVCLTVVNGARDFHTGQRLTSDLLKDPNRRIEDHHLFPTGFLKKMSPPRPSENSILNRCLIDHKTNKLISDNPPSKYVALMERHLGSERVDDILGSHLIPYGGKGSLTSDDVGRFLEAREHLMIGAIAGVTGAAVPSVGNVDTYLDPSKPFTNELALRKVIRGMRGRLFWYEQHMPRKVLEVLAEELNREDARGVWLLSGPANIDDRTQRSFERFRVEMEASGVEALWRVLPDDVARRLHARVLFDDNAVWELPPLNSLLMGAVDSIRISNMGRESFLKEWASDAALPLQDFRGKR